MELLPAPKDIEDLVDTSSKEFFTYNASFRGIHGLEEKKGVSYDWAPVVLGAFFSTILLVQLFALIWLAIKWFVCYIKGKNRGGGEEQRCRTPVVPSVPQDLSNLHRCPSTCSVCWDSRPLPCLNGAEHQEYTGRSPELVGNALQQDSPSFPLAKSEGSSSARGTDRDEEQDTHMNATPLNSFSTEDYNPALVPPPRFKGISLLGRTFLQEVPQSRDMWQNLPPFFAQRRTQDISLLGSHNPDRKSPQESLKGSGDGDICQNLPPFVPPPRFNDVSREENRRCDRRYRRQTYVVLGGNEPWQNLPPFVPPRGPCPVPNLELNDSSSESEEFPYESEC